MQGTTCRAQGTGNRVKGVRCRVLREDVVPRVEEVFDDGRDRALVQHRLPAWFRVQGFVSRF